MSEQTIDEGQTPQITGESHDIQVLRAAFKENGPLKEENTSLKRELAFVKAGIDTDAPAVKYFVKGYDGEVTVEAITAAAVEAGFLQAPQADPAVAQAQAGQQAVQAAAAGAQGPRDAAGARAAMAEALASGGEEAMLNVGRQFGLTVAKN